VVKLAEQILTKEKIEQDIRAYQERIHAAKDKLATLSAKGRTPAERRKLKTARHRMMVEIEHVKQLILYAERFIKEGSWVYSKGGVGRKGGHLTLVYPAHIF
jgi:hypothetical protein